MAKLNYLLHQELRLRIISFLATVEDADFKRLLEVSLATKGNLSVQISKLEEAGYIEVIKTFKGKYPHTKCMITLSGKRELEEYISNLKEMLNI
jgi:DNA-binding MarR family transcriptional regulator